MKATLGVAGRYFKNSKRQGREGLKNNKKDNKKIHLDKGQIYIFE